MSSITCKTSSLISGLYHRTHAISSSDQRTQLVANRVISETSQLSQVSPLSFQELMGEIGRQTYQYQHPLPSEENIDWKEKANAELETLVHKTSALVIVKCMDSTISQQTALAIVKEAGHHHQSIYTIFMKMRGSNLSFFQKVKANISYFLNFQCGIIPNTLNTLMPYFLEKLRTELVQKDGGTNLAALNDRLLSDMSSFLSFYLEAINDYRTTTDSEGEISLHISKKIALKTKLPREEICRQFAQTIVSRLPRIFFFQTFRNSPWKFFRLTGFVLNQTFGRIVNRIVHQMVEKNIVENFVKTDPETKEKTQFPLTEQTNKLPFVISITKGIIEQLRKFQQELSKQICHPKMESKAAYGADKLPEVVKKLLEILQLEPYKTQTELQKNHDQIFHNPIPIVINNRLEKALIDGCQSMLCYISDEKNSEQIFYKMINCLNAPFDSTVSTTPDQLKQQYLALQEEMSFQARTSFQMLAQNSVKEYLEPKKDLTEQYFSTFQGLAQSRLTDMVKKFEIANQSIHQKLKSTDLLRVDPSTDNLIVDELNQLVDEIESVCNWIILQNTQKFPPSIQKGVEEALALILDQLKKLNNQIIRSRTYQSELCSLRSSYDCYQKMNDQLKNITSKNLPEVIDLQYDLDASDDLATKVHKDLLSIQTRNQIIHSLDTLLQEDGILSALYQKSLLKIAEKKASFNIKEIQNNSPFLTLLPEEQAVILNCVKAITTSKNREELLGAWSQLQDQLNFSMIFHRSARTQLIVASQKTIDTRLRELHTSMKSTFAQLGESSENIDQIVQRVSTSCKMIRVREVTTLSSQIIKTMGNPTAIGAIFGILSYFLPFRIGSALVGGAWGACMACRFHLSPVPVIATGAAGVAAGIAASFLPYPIITPVVPLLMGTTAGAVVGNPTTITTVSDFVSPQIMNTFDNFYKFILKDEVWDFVVYDSLKCVTGLVKKSEMAKRITA